MSFDMTSRNLFEVEAVSGNDVLNPRLFLGEGSLDGAFVISGVRKTSVRKSIEDTHKNLSKIRA